MLVIISDLHLNDGTTGATLAPGAASLFIQRLRETALASWRADGAYRPVERIDLVLLGDTFDLLHSEHWRAAPTVRPWGDLHAPEFFDQIATITKGILTQNQESLAMFRRGGGVGDNLAADVASGAACPAVGRAAGQRPHPLHGGKPRLVPPCRRRRLRCLAAGGGRADGAGQPARSAVSHDITESDELLQTMRRHKVTARHGDIYDPLSFEGDRDASSLSDAIVIDLVGRFAAEVEAAMGDSLPVATLLELLNWTICARCSWCPSGSTDCWSGPVRPWRCGSASRRSGTAWPTSSSPALRPPARPLECTDLVDGLARALKYSKRTSSGWSSAILQWLQKIRGAESPSYYPHALSEADFRNRRAKHVVYGHTHAAQCLPLDASYAEGCVLDQMYFNAGTWRRVHGQTLFTPGGHEFIASDAMTYLAFFQGDERGGRPYETWSGTLGHQPTEMIVHRIDPARVNPVAGRVVSPSSLPVHAPHFVTRPGQSTGLPARRR